MAELTVGAPELACSGTCSTKNNQRQRTPLFLNRTRLSLQPFLHPVFMRRFLSLYFFAASAFAADAQKLPEVPSEAIGKPMELLFADNFERSELGEKWGAVVPTFTIERGALKGTQTRFDAPAPMCPPKTASSRSKSNSKAQRAFPLNLTTAILRDPTMATSVWCR